MDHRDRQSISERQAAICCTSTSGGAVEYHQGIVHVCISAAPAANVVCVEYWEGTAREARSEGETDRRHKFYCWSKADSEARQIEWSQKRYRGYVEGNWRPGIVHRVEKYRNMIHLKALILNPWGWSLINPWGWSLTLEDDP